MRDKVFVVEFIGVSGSGKTTLCERVAALLNEQGEPVRYNLRPPARIDSDRLWFQQLAAAWMLLTRFIGALFVNPLRGIRFLLALYKTRQASLRDLLVIKSIWADYVLQSRKYQAQPGIVLLDEARFHLLWACLLHARQRSMVKNLAQLEFDEGLPDLVICLEVEPSTIERRLQHRRGRTRLERLIRSVQMEHAVVQAVENYKEIRGLAESLAANGSGMRVLRLRNDQDESLDDVATSVVRMINWARARARGC